MAEPWKKYEGQSGPWTKYGGQPAPSAQEGALGQLNRGIARTTGGLVDFINPFDDPVWQDTAIGRSFLGGSAEQGVVNAMRAGGAYVADTEPDTVLEGFTRGAGDAAGALIPIVKGLQALSKARGVPMSVAQFADDAYKSLTTRFMGGTATEVAAGGLAGAAEEGAEQAGAPEWVQQTAAIAAPGSLAALPATARLAGRGAGYVGEKLPVTGPLVTWARRLPGQVTAAVAPYTEAGARRIAGDRMVELAGSPERAEQLASRVTEDNPLRMTPAQQTGDPNMIALEQSVSSVDADLAARLRDRADTSVNLAREGLASAGGQPEAAQQFLADLYRRFANDMTARVNADVERATGGVANIRNVRPTSENSVRVMQAIDESLERELAEEARLWDAVPRGVQMPAVTARARAQQIIDATSWAQRDDIPRQVRELLEQPEMQTVNELHGLYSKLRQVARSAMAGSDQNKNMARIANTVADAILEDLGAVDGTTAIGRQINEARTFSRTLHETFDQGEVGRLRTRTLDGDTTTAPEVALDRSVGRGGAIASVGDRQIGRATGGDPETGLGGDSRVFVADYIKERFNRRAFDAEGNFTRAGAAAFRRDNAELLARYPELRADIDEAVRAKLGADEMAERVAGRLAALRDKRRSAAARFIDAAPDKAFEAVLSDRNPASAAARLVASASKDPSGEALDGLKGAASEYLISKGFRISGGRQTANADALVSIFENPRQVAALRRIFDSGEMTRLQRIARELVNLEASQRPQRDIGPIIEGRANRVVDMAARIVAARQGADLGGGGAASLQTAQMASSRMKEALGYLVADKASQLLADAIEDPALFRALLTEMTPKNEARIINRLWPYLIGGSVAATTQE